MYYYGGGSTCCNNPGYTYAYPYYTPGTNSSYAIVLVLFILLVIVLGARFTR